MKPYQIAALRDMLHGMETDLGLESLSPTQRDVYYAASLLVNEGAQLTASTLQDHRLTKHLSRPTFFRSLKWLVSNGYLIKDPKTTKYILADA